MVDSEVLAASLSAIAATAAAVAAWVTCVTAHKALDFEKRHARNQATLVQLNSTLGKLLKLRGMLWDPLGASDDEFLEVEPMYRDCQADLERLAATSARSCGQRQIAALDHILPPFSGTTDRVANVDRAIMAVQAGVAQILR